LGRQYTKYKGKVKVRIKQYVIEITTPLREVTCHKGSHSVTCRPAAVTFLLLPQPKLVLDIATLERCKVELSWEEVLEYRKVSSCENKSKSTYSANSTP